MVQELIVPSALVSRNMMGIESQGMILSAVDFDESLSVVTTTKDVKPGSQVG